LAQRAPGFAGVYFDEDGRLTINFGSTTFDAAAVAEVVAWVRRVTGRVPDANGPVLRRVGFAYAILDSYYDPLLKAVAALPFLTSSRIDDVRAQIVITVSDIAYAPSIREVASKLGIPPGAVVVEQRDPLHYEQTLQERVRPVYGGLEILSDAGAICSLGLNGYYAGPDPSRPRVFMTASHCGGIGTIWAQNTTGYRIGATVHDAVVIFPPSCFSGDVCCPYPEGCQLADESVAEYDDSVSQGYGRVYKTNLNSLTITGTYSVAGPVYGAVNGEVVWKVGRTTGTTNGRVTASCVDFPPAEGHPGKLCQQAANYTSGNGDSGSPVFMPYDPAYPDWTPRTVGIHFGREASGTRYYSPINNISGAQEYQFFW
jgi:hypothetical protein